MKIKDWNGKEIAFAQSRGGVGVVAHPFDNLIQTGCTLPGHPLRSFKNYIRVGRVKHLTTISGQYVNQGLGIIVTFSL
jgi:hypothetical protein